MLRVVGVSTGSSILAWLGPAPDIELGQTLEVAFIRSADLDVEKDISGDTAEDLQSILDVPAESPETQSSRKRGPQLRGRIMLSFAGLRSTTKWETSTRNSNTRTFSTPTVSLRGVLSRLPGGLSVSVNSRMSYRYSSGNIVSHPESVRFYRFSVSRSVPGSPLDMEAGRFSNSNEPGTGYWDGLLVRRRDRRLDFGIALGMEPNRYNEGFRSDLPKYSVFVSLKPRPGKARLSADLSFTQLRPQNGWLTHTYIGLVQKLRVGALSLNGDLQLDRDPISNGWIVTRMKSRGFVRLSGNTSVQVRYSIRQPYAYWRTERIISYRRDQASVGITYSDDGARLGLSVTDNSIDSETSSQTYSLNFALPALPFIQADLSGTASYWERSGNETTYGSLSLSREVRGARLALLYSLYRASLYSQILTSHTAGLSLQVPLTPKMHASLQGRTQFGNELTSTSVFASIWWSF